jgi:hypothetical protein
MCRFVYPSCVKFGDREARAEPYWRDDNQYFLKTNRNFLVAFELGAGTPTSRKPGRCSQSQMVPYRLTAKETVQSAGRV